MPVGYKVIIPFVILSMIVGALASAVVSQQLAASATSQLDAQAIREEDVVSASFAGFEQRQLTEMRLLTGTEGVASALSRRDVDSLRQLLFPPLANQLPDLFRASVITPDGQELMKLQVDPKAPRQCLCTSGRDLSDWPHVGDVLSGKADSRGPKYAGVHPDIDGTLLYTIAPVVDNGKVVGAVLAGEPLVSLLNELRVDNKFELAVFQPNGAPLASTTSFPVNQVALSPQERSNIMNQAALVRQPSGGSSYAIFVVPWKVRQEVVGYGAVEVPAGILTQAAATVPKLLIGIFAGALTLTFLVGVFVTRRITRPLRLLVHATEEVAKGKLDHRAEVVSRDEIGVLARSFNDMTSSLEEKTALLESATEETVQTLAAAIDARDPYTHGHSLRVAIYSVELAKAAGMSSDEVDIINRGCLVHDIGKIAIPDRILGKPGPLTSEERAEMEKHPVVGHNMLGRLSWYTDVLEIVLHHHERWDGEGYPQGLSAENIPLRARLVAVADTLDAMTSDRPYRRGYPFARAAAEIERSAGTQFDPDMVVAFVRIRERLGRMVGTAQETTTVTAEVPTLGVSVGADATNPLTPYRTAS